MTNTFERQQPLLDELPPAYRTIATLRLNHPIDFRGIHDDAIDINWMDIHPDRKSLLLKQAIETILTCTMGINIDAIVVSQHVEFKSNGMGYPCLRICLPIASQAPDQTNLASAAVTVFAQELFSDIRCSSDLFENLQAKQIIECRAIATQVAEKFAPTFGNSPLSNPIDIELPNVTISCSGSIKRAPKGNEAADDNVSITGRIVEWKSVQRCFAVKHAHIKAEWIFYGEDTDPWRILRDFLGEDIVVQVTARKTVRGPGAHNESYILTFESFVKLQGELFTLTD